MQPLSPLSLCGTPILSAPVNPQDAARIASLFRVLGEPARLQLLSYIASQPLGEACVCELTDVLDLSQPTISHHLKVMYDVGLLSKERRGSWIYYKIVPEIIEALRNALLVTPQ